MKPLYVKKDRNTGPHAKTFSWHVRVTEILEERILKPAVGDVTLLVLYRGR